MYLMYAYMTVCTCENPKTKLENLFDPYDPGAYAGHVSTVLQKLSIVYEHRFLRYFIMKMFTGEKPC